MFIIIQLDLKRKYIMENMDFDTRLMVNSLCSLTLTSMSLSLKTGVIRSFRNGTIGFVVLGTLIVPELINPFLGMTQKE